MKFRQGDLSIIEFDNTFRRMSRHHEGTYGNPLEMKIQALIALNLDYRELVAVIRLISYEDLIEMALNMEQTR